MTDLVRVPGGDSISDTATLLLAAAEATDGFDAQDVKTSTHGPGFGFVVPSEIAKAAGLDGDDYEVPDPAVATVEQTTATEQAKAEAPKAPAKKTAAKKTTAKKTAAKKTAAKKTAAKKTAAKA